MYAPVAYLGDSLVGHFLSIRELMSFKNKTVIVTGAGQGIGFEICRRLASEGANVLLNDIDKDLANDATKRITTDTGGICKAIVGDSGDIEFVRYMVSHA